MIKKIFSLLVIAIGSTAFLVSCDNDEPPIKTYSSLVDVSGSSIEDSKYDVVTVFSTDGGATFHDYPNVTKGGTYLVKAVDRSSGRDVTDVSCLDVDWSASNPQPNSVTSGVAEFTMGANNQLVGKVTDVTESDYIAAGWAGHYLAVEDYGGGSTYGPYDLVLTQDPTNPNRFHMDNFYDQGLAPYIDFDGATGTVKFPDQLVGEDEDPLTNSSGTFVQCPGSADITLNFDGGDWVYHLTRN